MMLNKAYEASEEILSKGRGLIQTVCYFLGQVTERMDHELFQEHEDKIFYIVNKCFIDPSMQSEFKGEAKDNAISALL